MEIELVTWLRKEADERSKRVESRRAYARSGENLTEEDRKIAHSLAEQMSGRRLPKTSAEGDKKIAEAEERIARRLEKEGAMLAEFAAEVTRLRVENEALKAAVAQLRQVTQIARRALQNERDDTLAEGYITRQETSNALATIESALAPPPDGGK